MDYSGKQCADYSAALPLAAAGIPQCYAEYLALPYAGCLSDRNECGPQCDCNFTGLYGIPLDQGAKTCAVLFANSDGSIVPQKCSGLSAAVLVGEPAVEISPCVVLYHGSLHLGRSISGCGGARANLLPYALAKYFTKSNSRMESIAVGAFYALLVAFVLYKMTPEECKKLESKEPQGLFLTMAALSLYGLNLGLASAARMAALFGPYLIVLLPRMLEYINCPRRRAATIQWLAVAAGLQYVLRLLINNIGGTMPYQFSGQHSSGMEKIF